MIDSHHNIYKKYIRKIKVLNYPYYRATIDKYTLANLNLRGEKSLEGNILTVIPKGERVEVMDIDEEWTKGSYKGLEGYLSTRYLSESKFPWSNLNLREDRSTSSRIITTIPKGERVEILEEGPEWSRAVYNGLMGYVNKYYLSQDGNPPGDINYKDFYRDMSSFVNSNNIQSPTDYLLVTDLINRLTYVFRKSNNSWQQLYKWSCTVGKPETPTVRGIFDIKDRKPGFGTNLYSVKYATRIIGGYYYHSILYNSTGSYVIDGRLGQALSHGCIRLATENAKWIYENVPNGTTVVIH